MNGDFDHIVLGGGISGLGMAHFSVRKGIKTLVLEQADRIGGCIRSHIFPKRNGYWAELGSHTCFNSYGNLLEILDDLGLMGQVIPKTRQRYMLYAQERMKSVFSALHPLEMAFSLPRIFFTSKQGKSVAQYYTAVLGKRNFRDLFAPAFDAVICQPAADFPADALFRKKPRRKEIARSFTLPHGLSGIAQAIAEQKGIEVLTAKDVQHIQHTEDGFLLSWANGTRLRSRYLTLAVPPDAAANLLPEAFTSIAPILKGIGSAAIESVSICVPRSNITLPPTAGLIAIDDDFFSMVSRDYLPDEDYRGFTFHFRAGRLSPNAQEERIGQVLNINIADGIAISRARNHLPALRTEHENLVRQIDQALAGSPLAITGNYFAGVSIEDCLIRTRSEFQRLFQD